MPDTPTKAPDPDFVAAVDAFEAAAWRCETAGRKSFEKAAAEYKAARAALLDMDAKMRAALEWYEANVWSCRLVGSVGDEARNALTSDAGERAHAALNQAETGR